MTPDRRPPLTDEELLAGLQAGRRDLFGELVHRYKSELYGYLRRYVGADDLAADVFQNTFLALYTKIGQYQLGRAARPWIYTVATNQAIDALRRKNRRARRTGLGNSGELLDDAPAPGVSPDASAELAESRARVRAAVDALPELLRQVILLAYFQGLKYQEIADTLGVPLGTVKSRLHAAVARLGEAWTADNPEDDR